MPDIANLTEALMTGAIRVLLLQASLVVRLTIETVRLVVTIQRMAGAIQLVSGVGGTVVM